MIYDMVIATALTCIPSVREFNALFPHAEHTLVKAKRNFDPDGWQIVYKWISRTHLHDRYVVWLVMAIDVNEDGSISELEKPQLYVVEIQKVKRGGDGQEGSSWEFRWAEFEDGDWELLVERGGDFGAIDLEMKADSPVDGFARCWHDTRPKQLSEPPPGGVAFKAPLRFMMQ